MYDIVGKRNWYFALSALLTIPGLIFVLLGGLKPSVDFTGGTVWEVRFASQPAPDAIQAAFAELGYSDAEVRTASDGYVEIRTEPIDLIPPGGPVSAPLPSGSALIEPSPAASAGLEGSPAPVPSEAVAPLPSPSVNEEPSTGTELAEVEAALVDQFGAAETRSLRTVGPIIGAELIRGSIILIVIGELFILAYLWIRFGFRYGTAAIVALLHDVVVVVGIFAILGYFFGMEFDALFVTALLTIIGFSVHDTIVVFDRIRENRVRHANEPFGAIVNHSILQTLGRSINTSLTVVVTLGALLLLGPATIRTFSLALLIGVVSGTYSSIFNASQILVAWHEWDAKRKARAGGRAVKPLSR
ncbi:MAG: protein translocase subunit SecF [Chloroflexota bacterium]